MTDRVSIFLSSVKKIADASSSKKCCHRCLWQDRFDKEKKNQAQVQESERKFDQMGNDNLWHPAVWNLHPHHRLHHRSGHVAHRQNHVHR